MKTTGDYERASLERMIESRKSVVPEVKYPVIHDIRNAIERLRCEAARFEAIHGHKATHVLLPNIWRTEWKEKTLEAFGCFFEIQTESPVRVDSIAGYPILWVLNLTEPKIAYLP